MKSDNAWIYALIWGAVLFLIAYCLTGCDVGTQIEQAPVVPGLKVHQIIAENQWSNIYYIQFEIDGCEYIHFYTGKGTTMHKPNCKNHTK